VVSPFRGRTFRGRAWIDPVGGWRFWELSDGMRFRLPPGGVDRGPSAIDAGCEKIERTALAPEEQII